MKLKDRVEEALKKNLPFVVFRRPNEKKTQSWFLKNDNLVLSDDFIEDSFVFAPFGFGEKVFFLRENSEVFEEEVAGVFSDFKEVITTDTDKEKHISLVKKGIEAIRSGEFSKVVLARREEVQVEKELYFLYYQRMLHKYSTAYVYWWYHPKKGMWMGATPELLLRKEHCKIYTVSLAGTVSAVGKTKSEIVWGAKEKAEQQIVTDFIVAILQNNCQFVKTSGAYTHQAGNLFHLKTEIEAEIEADVHLKDIIYQLHPTPALCGFPKEKARDFIEKNEGFCREYYGGFLGEYQLVDKIGDRQTQLYVNLRSMQIKGNSAFLYIGGGINNDSIAEKEYEETVNKSRIIKQVL